MTPTRNARPGACMTCGPRPFELMSSTSTRRPQQFRRVPRPSAQRHPLSMRRVQTEPEHNTSAHMQRDARLSSDLPPRPMRSPSTPSHLWRIPRRNSGHVLIQKITCRLGDCSCLETRDGSLHNGQLIRSGDISFRLYLWNNSELVEACEGPAVGELGCASDAPARDRERNQPPEVGKGYDAVFSNAIDPDTQMTLSSISTGDVR
jgi:hypothetical protein